MTKALNTKTQPERFGRMAFANRSIINYRKQGKQKQGNWRKKLYFYDVAV
jgi:hypothetical protein